MTKLESFFHPGETLITQSKIGWTVFGPNPHIKNRPLTRCNLVRFSEELLEKKVDVLLHELFAERPHDFNCAPSVDDKVVLKKYKSSIKVIDNRFQRALPFKKGEVEMPITTRMRLIECSS